MNIYQSLAEFFLNEINEGIPRARVFLKKIDEIESLLSRGITYRKIVEELNNNGFNITLKLFEQDLRRTRNKLKKKGNNKATALNVTDSKTEKESKIKDDDENQTPKEKEDESKLITNTSTGRRKTLKEISAEVNKMFAENKRPLY